MIERTSEEGTTHRSWTIDGGYKIRELSDGSMELTCHDFPVCPRVEAPVRETRECLERVAEKDKRINALEAQRDAIEARLETLCERQEELIREAVGGFARPGGEEEGVLFANSEERREAFVLSIARGAGRSEQRGDTA